MKKGDVITFTFAKRELPGTVERAFDKTVYIRADFPKHKGKIVKRKIKDVKG